MEPEYLYAVRAIQETDWPKFYAKPEEQWPSLYKDLLQKHRQRFVTRNDQVYRLIKNGEQTNEVRYVLFARRADLVQQFHTGFGHPGNKTLYDLIKKRYWWPDMQNDINTWIKECPQCQLASNADRHVHHAPMKPLDIPAPFARWHLDFIGELPPTVKGNRWLLVAVDSTTNWTCARAVRDATGEAIAKFMHEEIVMHFGCPHEIVTDRGANFLSNILAHYLGRLKIQHKRTSAFHPRTNAKAERTNGILKQMLRKYVNGAIHRWDEFVDTAVFACRIRKHRTTGLSPFYMVYGRDPVLPGDTLQPMVLSNPSDDPQALADSRLPELRKLRDSRNQAINRLQRNAQLDKQRWDAVLKPQDFSVGDIVAMRHENKLSLEYNWKGPYCVIGKNQEYHTYKLEDMQGKVYSSMVHTDRLRPLNVKNPIPEPWYDPASSRAQERQRLIQAASTSMHEDVQ
ncbi:integrase core domain containing protein [Lichtheimia corymbifera JMRC:FSU:9682]|uniref:Integrase core domain containing protein n=1 Tax=Lichtheimia corymbifera JMRC:FSU:9682 TaxID=1263082 RepID=A0A068SH10_9FUNG|nr:integrase core domain containing protein [Lichtheimia corymbifera JMRC:FSU:9682]